MNGQQIKTFPKPTVTWSVVPFAWLLFLTAYLFWVAWHLSVDYFDTFQIYLNAKSFASLENGYNFDRPIFMPLILAPFFHVGNFFHIPYLVFTLSHMLVATFFASFLWLLYRLFRLQAPKGMALLGVFLCSLNGLLIHYAVFAKEDFPGMFFTTLTFYAYLKTVKKEKIKYYALTGWAITLAMMTRYNLFPLLFMTIGLYDLCTRRAWKRTVWKILFFFIIPFSLFFLAQSAIFAHFQLSSFWDGPRSFLQRASSQYSAFCKAHCASIPVFQNYFFLLKSCTAPVIVLAVIGTVQGLRSKSSGTLFHLLWFAPSFLFLTHIFRGDEARYLLPVFPPFYFLAAQGLVQMMALGPQTRNRLAPRLWPAIALVVFLLDPARQALGECRKFRDPVYRINLEKEVSLYANGLAKENRIHWLGQFYPIHPKDYFFDPEDEYTSIYHFASHVVRFYTGKATPTWMGIQYQPPAQGSMVFFPGPNLPQVIKDGDVLIMNLEPDSYNTKSLPKTLSPLMVQRAQMVEFALNPPDPNQAGVDTFSHGTFGARIQIDISDQGYRVQGRGVADGRYELCLKVPFQPEPLSFAVIDVRDNHFELLREDIRHKPPLEKIVLLYYDAVKPFFIPTEK